MSYTNTDRKNWLPLVCDLKPLDIVRIHPLDGLTPQMVVDAMKAQGLDKLTPSYVVQQHGTCMLIQRKAL